MFLKRCVLGFSSDDVTWMTIQIACQGMDPVLYVMKSCQVPVVFHTNILKTPWVVNSGSDLSLCLNAVPKVNLTSPISRASIWEKSGKTIIDNIFQPTEKIIRVSLWETFQATGQRS